MYEKRHSSCTCGICWLTSGVEACYVVITTKLHESHRPFRGHFMPIRNTTAYSFIADVLRREIIRGKIRAGGKMPTERELCARFFASRITVRRALQILADELLIVRRQGTGTFVSGKPSRKIPLLNTDF